jgi:hypothetical protein
MTMVIANTPITSYPTNYVAYVVNANQVFMMSTDTHASYDLLAGSAQSQTQPTFDVTSMNGPMIGYENVQPNPGALGVTLPDLLNLSTSTIFRTVGGTGVCNFTNVDIAGISGILNQASGVVGAILPISTVTDLLGTYQSTGNATCTVSGNGRGVLNYPAPSGLLATLLDLLGLNNPPAPRVFYLSAPNKGYFLETGYAGLGNFEPQTGGPYTLANFSGTFIYGNLPGATVVGVNRSGILQADGAGNVTTTIDQNVGVGSLNILQSNQVTSGTYVYAPNTTPSDSTVGRYTFNTDTIYEISPGRFVLLDKDPTTTSPTVTLLY